MPQPTRLTSGIARSRRKLRTEGVDFPLVGTVDDDGNPTVARVRVPDLLDLGSLTKMPSVVQKIVQDRINEVEPGDAPPEPLDMLDLDDPENLMGQIEAQGEAVNTFVVLGFLEPKVYATEAEADEHEGVWVEDIDFMDRVRFVNWCTERMGDPNEIVAPFRQKPADAVPAGSTGRPVSGTRKPRKRAGTR